MNKKIIPSFLVVSKYKEDISWIYEYIDTNYLIYNKGDLIFGNPHVLNVENIGGNQIDIFRFSFDYYDKLPRLIAFVQGHPFDHCKKEVFNKLIYNEFYTPIEYYGSQPNNSFEARASDGGFVEINNSWYIPAHCETYGLSCKYFSFDEFMNKYFENYVREEYLRFTPGSQFIIEKEQILRYPKQFWKSLMEEISSFNSTEAHIIERSLNMILNNKLIVRKEFL